MAPISMERKVLGVFVVMLAGLIVAIVLVFITTRRLMSTAGWVSHTYTVMQRIQATQTAVQQAQSDVYGFVITGDNQFLNSKDSALSDLETDFIQLRNLTSDNPVEQQNLKQLSALIEDWQSRIADVQLAKQVKGFTFAQTLIQAKHIAAGNAKLFSVLNAMHAEEQRLLHLRLSEEHHRDDIVDFVYLLLCSLAIVVFIGVYLQISREIAGRRRTEEMFHGLFESAYDAVILSKQNGEIALMNSQAENLFGYTRDELIGQSIDMLVPERVRAQHPRHRAGYIAAAQTRMMGIGLELFARRKDGSDVPVDISLSPITTDDDMLVVSEIRDMTAHKQAERRIRELNTHLEQRASELEAVNKELEAFSYSVSHDLRAPLRAVDGFSRLLEDQSRSRLDAEGLRLLRVVRENSRKMGALIDDLLNFSRLGRKPVQRAIVGMRSLVDEALTEVLAIPETTSPAVEIGPLPDAWGDRALLKQVWTNLLGNAVKYSSKSKQPQIRVEGQATATENIYCVRDNGVGFDMRYAHKLFSVFQRLHGEGEFSGTGVGLATVKRIVAKHGGRVWAESKPDEGASFFFSLPHEEIRT